MRFIKIAAAIALTALAALLIYAAVQPDQFRVERSARIDAPPERIFALINDLRQFKTWNPYERKDPALKGRYGEIAIGPGASYAWESEKVGSGRMQILEASSPTRLTMQLDFFEPFQARNFAQFSLRPEDGGTRVTWVMHGPAPFVTKLMQALSLLDRMVGSDFESGLSNLKVLVERG